jgi:hypothetical protein
MAALLEMFQLMRAAHPDRLTRPGLARLQTSDVVERGQVYIINLDARAPFDAEPPAVILHPVDAAMLRETFKDPIGLMNADQAIADAVAEFLAAQAVKDQTFRKWPESWKMPLLRDPRPIVCDCQS